eukprot:381461_1
MDNLTQAVKQVLDEKGVLSELKAKIRAEIFESLQIGKDLGVHINDQTNDNAEKTTSTTKRKLKWNKQEVLIHEVIKEYMSFHGLQHSLSVFLSETNDNKSNKMCIASELDIDRDHDHRHPVIYDIMPTKPCS